MDKKRLFRALICFVVVCALVVNISPIKTYAYVGSLTSMGIIAMAFLFSAGVVFNPSTPEVVNALGTSLELGLQEWSDTVGNVSEDLSDLWAQADALDKWREKNDPYYSEYNPDFDDIPDAPEDAALKIKLAKGLLTGIAAWIGGAITSGILADGEAAPEGYAWYNDNLLPVFTDDMQSFVDSGYGYQVLGVNGKGQFVMSFYPSWVPWHINENGYLEFSLTEGSFSQISIISKTGEYWASSWSTTDSLIRTEYSSGYLWFNGLDGEPRPFEAIVIEPSTYIGDVAPGIQEGTHTYEDLDLPEIIDLGKLLPDSDTDTASSLDKMQDITKQLSDGQMTYEDLLKMLQSDLDSDVVPDSTTPTTPDEPVDTSTIQDYKLDLTEFFPFCIPFDIYEFLSILAAEPKAPVFEWKLAVPTIGQSFDIELDLSQWDSVAAVFRKLELMGFIIGLAYVTREKYIRG